MKKPLYLILLLSLLSITSVAQNLVFCAYPSKSNKAIYEQYQGLLEHLQQSLKQSVALTIASDYNNQIELLSSNKVHIAILGPYNYTKAKKQNSKIAYIATQQHLQFDKMISSYKAVIVTQKNSGIKSIQELKNKRFGFTDFNSTSGYLMPSLVLESNHIKKEDFSEYFMLKKHTHIMEAISRGSIDAGATHYDNYLKYVEKFGDIYHIIHESNPIPFDAIVVSGFLSKQLKHKIQQAFLSYKETIDNKSRQMYVKLDEAVYDEIKKKAKKLH